MSLAIIKSPSFAGQTVQIGLPIKADRLADGPLVDAQALARQQIEAGVREALEKEYRAKFESEREKAYEQGYKEGLESGHQEGVASGLEGFKKQTQLLERLVIDVEAKLEGWLARCQEVATDLAMDGITRILGENVLEAEVIAGMVQQVTTALRESDVLAIRLHPAECSALRLALRQSAAAGSAPSSLLDKLREDATLQSGGCVVETARGEYRAPLDVQLKQLRRLLDQQRAKLEVSNGPIRHVLCA
ncbi:MAG: FliH/SctL family protein [Aquabacterium sp.]|uniref:FliH/SctL family protein n=1 Tax=Aquabacterium sp. TaxID=1872578 RepID=UPI00271DDFA5|nr:FliH/SctL family protein [Aquabacterium sp.]MDO9005737.1 FliH/SctL family protein [Aquabacterium sp.]